MKWKGSLELLDASARLKAPVVQITKRADIPATDTTVGMLFAKTDNHLYFKNPGIEAILL